jgi:ubiquinone/menaquinone biosynthesis C-methylase UbiE
MPLRERMKTDKIKLFNHYKRLLFYSFNRFKGDNYSLMREYFAQILIMEVEEFMSLENKKVLDIGGARGEFCKVIARKRKCDAINLDPYPGKYVWYKTKIGFADNIPFDDNEFDLVICRGVLEHIPIEKQQQSVNEMYRVTKIGGICYIMIPPWYNPHAGHTLKPFHIFSFKLAKFLRQLIFRNKINATSFEEAGLYPITFSRMLKMVSTSGFKVVTTKDTHFRLHFLTKIPVIREIAVPAVSFILVKE